MRIEVQLFSILKECLPPDAAGQKAPGGKATITLPEGSTVADLLSHLGVDGYLGIGADEWVEKAGWQVLVAGSYEPDLGRVLQDGDPVLILPPISGG